MSPVRLIGHLVLFCSPLLFGAACTLSNDDTSTQCRSQDDCLARGPDFADTTCSAERVCVKQQVLEKGCTTNKECIDRNGGAPYTCRKDQGKCISLLSNECPSVFGTAAELLDDNAVYIGASGPADINGAAMSGVLEFARDEVMRTTRGLPPLTAGGPTRPIIAVFCNSEALAGAGTIDTAIRQVQHIADIGSPALFGNLANASQLPIINQAVIPRGLLHLSVSGLAEISNVVDNDLVFRIRIGNLTTTPLINPMLAALDAQAVTDGVKTAGEPLRVAIVRTLDPTGDSMSQSMLKVLNFNGKDATGNLTDGNLKLFDNGNPNDKISQPDAYQKVPQAISAIYAYAPHVIIHAAGPPNAALLFLPLMRTWPSATTPIPYSIGFLDAWSNVVPGILGAMPDLVRQRYVSFFLTPVDFDPTMQPGWISNVLNFKPDLAGALPTSNFGQQMYDSFYLWLYATAALGNKPLVGANYPPVIRKMNTGEPVNWGTTDLPKAFSVLTNGGTINYSGIFGTYPFDDKGDRAGFSEVVCYGAPPARPLTHTGYKVDGRTNTISGTFKLCP